MYPPLQSHGVMVKKWVPPKATRFISYTESDEPWAAYCGLGHYVQALAPWYDVISEDGKTCLGWIRVDPTSVGITGRLVIPFAEIQPLRFRYEQPLPPYKTAGTTTAEIQRRTWCRQSRFSKADCFEVWCCCRSDFPDLVKSGKAVKTIEELLLKARK